MVYVDKVHYTKDSYGNELYISEMKWTNALSENAYNGCTKADMIKFINDNPGCAHTKYYRYADGATVKKFTWSITVI